MINKEQLEAVGIFLASPTALAKINALISAEPAEKYITADPHAELKALYEAQGREGTTACYAWETRLKESGDWAKMADSPNWFSYSEDRCTPKPTTTVNGATMTVEAAKKRMTGSLLKTISW